MTDIPRFLPISFLLLISILSIHEVYAVNAYSISNNGCEFSEETEIPDCLRNELIESTILLRKAEDSTKTRIEKWSEEKSAALDETIPVALYWLEKSNKEFVRYRFAQCSLANTWGSGVGSFIRIYSCMAVLNRQRAEQLIRADI